MPDRRPWHLGADLPQQRYRTGRLQADRLGSWHGESRVIRMAYYEHPDYVPLLRRAYELWAEVEHESGERLLTITGGLMIGAPDSELVVGSLSSARQHGLDHEMLTAG